MPVYINTNISSLNAQRQLGSAGGKLDTAMERLSSGQRINSASDDAAGLAISNRQTSQIRGLDQAVRNANDGISLIQTAEGALQESTNILQRMRELSVQSANGIYGDSDRATLDAEVQQLVSELDRIADTTSFNGQNILDGSTRSVDLQVGSDANQTIGFELQAVDAETLGMGSLSADMVGAEMGVGSQLAIDDQDILINGQSIGAILSTDTMDEITAQITDSVQGVSASTVVEVNATSVGDGVVGTGGMSIDVIGGDGLESTYQVSNTENLQELADAINSNSNGALSATVDDDGKLNISAQGARSITINDGDAATGMVNAAQTESKMILSSDNGDDITIERGQGGTLLNLEGFGFRETDTAGVIEGVGMEVNSGGANEKLVVGDLTINGTEIGVTDTSSLAGKVAAINDVSDETGVTAVAYSTVKFDTAGMTDTALAATTDVTVNGIDLTFALANGDGATEIAAAFNAETDQTGVTARVKGTEIVLESDRGAITIAAGTTGGASFFGTTNGIDEVIQTQIDTQGVLAEITTSVESGLADVTAVAGLKLTATNGNPISIEFGDNSTNAEIQSRTGLREANTLGEGSFGRSLASISVDTASNAQQAIGVIDNALDTINGIRSELGAVNNRLDFTISNLSNVSENASAARSRIVDADFAKETAELSRAQVLQQASQAMLAQANSRPQQVLSLLQ